MIKCKNDCPLKKFEGCCHSCPEFGKCAEECSSDPNSCEESTFDGETGLQEFQTSQLATLNKIAEVVRAKKAAEEQEKTLKASLYDAMERYGIKKFESDVLNLTYVAPTTETRVDSAKLKKSFPDVYAQCTNTNPKAGYVKIKLKTE